MSRRIILGKLGAAYGVRGWLHITSFTDPLDNILEYTEWQVHHRGQWKTLHIEKGKLHGNSLVVKLKEISDRELAREYTNSEIAIPREILPVLSEEEYYWEDLVGAAVMTESGTPLGTVKEMMATGSNDVFVVIGERQRQRLIPYTEGVVIKIDQTKKEIIVNWDPEF